MTQSEPNFLYHYTTVETLALILKSKKIRFSPLDYVDDLEETRAKNMNNVGKYCFVSCFTSDEKESIPVWMMYSQKGSGVRLKLKTHAFNDDKFHFTDSNKLKASVQIDETPDGWIISSIDNVYSLIKVEYTDDEDLILPEINIDSSVPVSQKLKRAMGKYKRTHWEFQQEWRYVKFITAGNDEGIMDEEDIAFKYIDIKLKPEVLDILEITLGYNISAGNMIIVQKLVDDYKAKNENSMITIKESELTNKVK